MCLTAKQVVALSREDGSVLWKSAELPVWKEMATFYAPKLVVQGGVVMFVGGEDYVPHRGSAAGKVSGLATGKTGKPCGRPNTSRGAISRPAICW